MICNLCKKQIYPKNSTAYNVDFACDCKVTVKISNIDEIINLVKEEIAENLNKNNGYNFLIIYKLENLKKGEK